MTSGTDQLRQEMSGQVGAEPTQKKPTFVHLHTHSAFSLLEGAMTLRDLVGLAKADRQPALAVTDRNNLFGALEYSEKASQAGIQPIHGVKLAVDFSALASETGRDTTKQHQVLPSLLLLAASETGYRNLARLVSLAHLGETGEAHEATDTVDSTTHSNGHFGPHVTTEHIARLSDGLICLTGGPEGPINEALGHGQNGQAKARLEWLRLVFGNRLYVELQRHEGFDRKVEAELLDLSYQQELPIVATNQPYFAKRDDHEAHDALICIAEGTVVSMEDRRRLTRDHYFKSQSEMAVLFADLPEALENTIEIAQRCHYREQTRPPILPNFVEAGGASTNTKEETVELESEELARQARVGLQERLARFGLSEGFEQKDYEERLEFELGIIKQMGFPGYFLIVSDFINWAKERDIPVGPGRGSGAGSIVAWSLKITDLDPLRFNLLFERFLNPERLSMPDFDIDFCQDRREEVIKYVQGKYGREQVAQIITFGTLQARAVLRDVGRVLQMPYGLVDRICKLVPNNPANPVTLQQAINEEPKLRQEARDEPIVERLYDIAKRLEGLYRHASTHAAGIVIGDRKLDELVPLYRDPRSDMPVTQYNMKWVEPAGLVKFDFLGLKTLTVLKTAVNFLAERGEEIDLTTIPLDHKPTFDMLTKGETVGVFQLESQGMRKALVGMRPDRFEDIIALVALYRPGPMDNIPTYNARKHGEEEPDYYEDAIRPVLEETYGVIIYQEQVLQIARILSGYSLGEADFLRKAMGKKIPAEMDKQRQRFVDGAQKEGLSKARANEIFDVLAKFAGYGFNKAHAACYALVSYQTAWLKAVYPVEFLAASMELDLGNTDKLSVFYREAKAHGIEVVLPSVQTSDVGFSVQNGKIYYALAAIKGVGEGAVEHIVSDRKANGEYVSLTDFFTRLDVKHVNRRTLESLIMAGALDCFGTPREQLLGGLDRLVGHSQRVSHGREIGQSDMFGLGTNEEEVIHLPVVDVWSAAVKLQNEFSAVGFYLSAHPLDEYASLMQKLRVQLYGDFEKSVRAGASAARLAGTIVAKQIRKTRTGKRMGILTLSDPSGQYEAVIFEESLNRFDEILEVGRSVILMAGADMRPEGISIRINSAEPLETSEIVNKQSLRVFVEDETPIEHVAPLLTEKGSGSVSIVVLQRGSEVEVEVGRGLKVTPELAGAMKSLPGVVQIEMV